jgi:hypothetical protein
MKTLDSLSGGDRTKWDYYLDMNVIDFLNWLSFQKDKQRMAQLNAIHNK